MISGASESEQVDKEVRPWRDSGGAKTPQMSALFGCRAKDQVIELADLRQPVSRHHHFRHSAPVVKLVHIELRIASVLIWQAMVAALGAPRSTSPWWTLGAPVHRGIFRRQRIVSSIWTVRSRVGTHLSSRLDFVILPTSRGESPDRRRPMLCGTGLPAIRPVSAITSRTL
jgi:hypothetical protein